MGSMEGYEKGGMPFLDHIRKLNADHAEACRRAFFAMPRWRRYLFWIRIRSPVYRWFYREPLSRHWPTDAPVPQVKRQEIRSGEEPVAEEALRENR